MSNGDSAIGVFNLWHNNQIMFNRGWRRKLNGYLKRDKRSGEKRSKRNESSMKKKTSKQA